MRLLTCLSLLFTTAVCYGQQPSAPLIGDQPVIAMYGRIAAWTSRLEAPLGQMKTQEWVAKGASDTYAQQAASALAQLQSVGREMVEMQSHPEALQDGMKALFRVQVFQRTLTSVLSGLRRYQNPALADLIVEMAAESGPDLQALEAHLLEVASQKEREYVIVEREAQRCRGVLTREPAAAPRPVVRKPVQ